MGVHGLVRTRLMAGAGIVACSVLACLAPVVAQAQAGGGGGRGPQLSPEKTEAAWAAQSGGVSQEHGISGENATKLAAAYKESRASQGKAMQELMATAERGPGMFQEMQAINEAEAAALKTKLAEFLSGEEVDAVMPALGSYNRQWDRFTDTLLGFGLEADALQKGHSEVVKYVVASEKARAEAMAAMDMEAMRAASQKLKAELDESMGGILSAEQLTAWKEATQMRGRGGGGPGGGGGRPGN